MRYNSKNKKNRIKYYTSVSVALVCVLVCVSCFIIQMPTSIQENNVAIATAAAGLTMPEGASAAVRDGLSEEKESSRPEEVGSNTSNTATINSRAIVDNSNTVAIETHTDIEGVVPEGVPISTPSEGETTYSINERHIGTDGAEVVGNVAVKNTTGVNINIEEELQKEPDVNIATNTEAPQVIIYHTHTTESYMTSEQSVYPQSFYPRTTEEDYSVVAVGDAVARQLQQAGISVVHDTTIHDNPSYVGSYYRSEDTVTQLLAQYPSATVTIDIHRDAIGNDEVGRSKPTFTVDGEKAAQIMIVAGCDPDGSVGLPDWEYNLRLALRLQQTAETMYPGMTRPLQFCNSQYNMNMTHGSLLIEVGADVNTIDEAKRSGEYLGNALADTLKSL